MQTSSPIVIPSSWSAYCIFNYLFDQISSIIVLFLVLVTMDSGAACCCFVVPAPEEPKKLLFLRTLCIT